MQFRPTLIAMTIATSLLSANAMAELKANDSTNKIDGTYNGALMRSTDNGESWLEFAANDGTDAGVNNDFPGAETVVVANRLDEVIQTPLYDPTLSYSQPNTRVRYNGYYWTNQWWANPGEMPGSNAVWLKGAPTNLEQNVVDSFNFTPWTGQEAEDYQKQQKEKVANQTKIYGYYPEWGVYEAHNYFTPDKIAWDLMTHISYAFAIIKDGVVITHDTEKGPELMKELASASEQNGVTNILSVGGWTNSEDGVFESATSTPEGVEKLAQSIVDYMIQWKFDGVDIDWEYPDSDQEKTQFTNLITSLRTKLDDIGKKNDRYYQLSAAVTVNHNAMSYINPSVTASILDSVNVMAYDIHGAFDPITGHNAPLYANSQDEDQKLNISSAISEYVNTWGIPKNKLTMGIPFYGRGWGDVQPTEKVAGLPGLFVPGSATVHGAWDDEGQFTGTNPFYVLQQKLASGQYTRYWDAESHVPYLYNASSKEFLTYDDESSIADKVNYIKDQGLGGAIIWDISGDDTNHTLGKIVATLKDSDSDDDDDDDDTSVISYLTLSRAANDIWASTPTTGKSYFDSKTGLYTMAYGVFFEMPTEDFQSGIFDIRVNNISIAKVNKGKVTNGNFDKGSESTDVHTNYANLKEGDVVTVVRTDTEHESVQITKTVTKEMLGDAVLTTDGSLQAIYVLSMAGQSTQPYYAVEVLLPQCTNSGEYQVYLNDVRVSSVTTLADCRDAMDHMDKGGQGKNMAYSTSSDIVLHEGDDVKVYNVTNGNQVLAGHLTIPHNFTYY